MPPGRPPKIGTLALEKKKKKKINADQSICMSGSDNKTWPVEIRHSVRSTDKGHSSRLYEEVVSVI